MWAGNGCTGWLEEEYHTVIQESEGGKYKRNGGAHLEEHHIWPRGGMEIIIEKLILHRSGFLLDNNLIAFQMARRARPGIRRRPLNSNTARSTSSSSARSQENE